MTNVSHTVLDGQCARSYEAWKWGLYTKPGRALQNHHQAGGCVFTWLDQREKESRAKAMTLKGLELCNLLEIGRYWEITHRNMAWVARTLIALRTP